MKRYRFIRIIVVLLLRLIFSACAEQGDYVFIVTDAGDRGLPLTADGIESEPFFREDTALDTESDFADSVDSVTLAPTSEVPDESVLDSVRPDTDSLILLSVSQTVKRGGKAYVTVQGIPGETYSIQVRYSSSVSTAKGLEPKIAGADGKVTWEWRVGSRTKAGSHPIVVNGGGQSLSFSFCTE